MNENVHTNTQETGDTHSILRPIAVMYACILYEIVPLFSGVGFLFIYLFLKYITRFASTKINMQ